MVWEAGFPLPFLKVTSQKFKKRFFFQKNCVNLAATRVAEQNTNVEFFKFLKQC